MDQTHVPDKDTVTPPGAVLEVDGDIVPKIADGVGAFAPATELVATTATIVPPMTTHEARNSRRARWTVPRFRSPDFASSDR